MVTAMDCESEMLAEAFEVVACSPQPEIFKVIQKGSDVVLTWEAPEDEVDSYNVYLDGTLYQDNITETTFTFVKIPVGEYVFGVTSVTDDCESEMLTEPLEVVVCSPQPELLDPVQEDANVVLTWTITADIVIDSYNIYLDGILHEDNVTETTYTFVDAPEGTHLYGVSAIVGECESEIAEIEWTITSISEQKNIFNIYPNPVSGTLNISTTETITDCQIFNIQGQLIYSAKSNVKEIATDKWTSGVYIIRITTEKGNAERRFIKN
jgi:hypothetical protein